jgi:low affinity Fe/Cu permease
MKRIPFFLIALLNLFIWIIIGALIQKEDVIINETDTHITVKEYRMYNVDSIINVYEKPIRYEGVVVNKTSCFYGIVGKGGHRKYYVSVKYNNKEIKLNGRNLYNKYNEGDKVIVEEKFYPIEEINLYEK